MLSQTKVSILVILLFGILLELPFFTFWKSKVVSYCIFIEIKYWNMISVLIQSF